MFERISGAAMRQTSRWLAGRGWLAVAVTGPGCRPLPPGPGPAAADQKALTPVSSLPITSWCTVSVPS
jgi:hypothetical protein